VRTAADGGAGKLMMWTIMSDLHRREAAVLQECRVRAMLEDRQDLVAVERWVAQSELGKFLYPQTIG